MPESWTFVVRAAEPEDVDALGAVFVAAARAGWSDFLSADALDAVEPPAERWRGRLPSDDVLVTSDEQGIAGFVEVEPDDAEVGMLYTHPRVWGAGAGRVLLAAGLEVIRAAGHAEATLFTEERNARARRVYEAAGWRLDGGVRERVWQGEPLRELRYRIALVG